MNTTLINDLDAAYTALIRDNEKKGIIMNRRQICARLSKTPASRLYITPDYARRILRNFPKYCASRYGATGKHKELFDRYSRLPPEERTLMNITKIINQPAKSFYLSPKYIYVLLYKVYDRNNRRK